MLMLPSSTKAYVCCQAVSMSRSFDGLAGLVQDVMQGDPFSGHLFVFFNRRSDKVKILYWDRNGFALWYKRLEKGIFRKLRISGESYTLMPHELSMLLEGLDLNCSRHETLLLK